jgi:protoporphyrinogen oxidase
MSSSRDYVGAWSLMNKRRQAVIIGAGPAGLTAAYELLARTDIVPLVLEASERMGGLATTVEYKGNRLDIGPHRFFSKSDRVMDWWFDVLPLQRLPERQQEINYQGKSRSLRGSVAGPDPNTAKRVMLIVQRKTRIYWRRRFFDYPLSLSFDTLAKLGWMRVARIALSYAWSLLRPIRPEENLEQFFINRFGLELYRTFFKSYTEKVWGVPCEQISAAWGAQRIKGLSVRTAVWDFFRKLWGQKQTMGQENTETSLISQFLYPKYGPGQMWDEVARRVRTRGGVIKTGWLVDGLQVQGSRVVAVEARHTATGERQTFAADHVFSTMPVRELVRSLAERAPAPIREISEGLQYRDFILVGVLLRRLAVREADGSPLKDNWIYIQEPDVKVGRLQIMNNWSAAMVADPDTTVWVGLEYFCQEDDELWQRSDAGMTKLGIGELAKIGIIASEDVLDSVVIRTPKAYPAYFGTYDRFGELREWVDQFENLWLLGRNGMHRYNNQDHSMLTAMQAVDNIAAGRSNKANVWAVNTERKYHEQY